MYDIIKDKFEFYIGKKENKKAYISFYIENNTLTITHTIINDELLKGKGIGKLLVNSIIEYAKENNLKIKSECWFATKILEKDDFKNIFIK